MASLRAIAHTIELHRALESSMDELNPDLKKELLDFEEAAIYDQTKLLFKYTILVQSFTARGHDAYARLSDQVKPAVDALISTRITPHLAAISSQG